MYKKEGVVALAASQYKGTIALQPNNILSLSVLTGKPYDLYIVSDGSDQTIKAGDYGYSIKHNLIFRCDSVVPYIKHSKGGKSEEVSLLDDSLKRSFEIEDCKKVIATTDGSLLIPFEKIGYDDPIHKIPQIPKYFIEHFVSEYNKDNIIDEVMVEYNEVRKGTPMFPTLQYSLKVSSKYNTIKISSVKDSWSREEVEDLLWSLEHRLSYAGKGAFRDVTKEWIEENLL